jgi:hypothetical protein
VHAIGSNHERCEHSLPFHDQPGNPPILDNRALDSASGVNADSCSCRRLRIQDMIQYLATLSDSRLAESGSPWKISFHRSAIAVVSHAPEASSAHGICYAQAVQDGYSAGHESFAAWLFSRVLGALEQLHPEALPSEHDGE